jgi:cytochrome P450
MIRGYADELIDRFIGRGECDFRPEFADVLPIYVISHILGFSAEDVPLFERWGKSESQGIRYLSEERVQQELELQRQADVYITAALEQRLAAPTDDFLTELMQAQIEVDGEIDMEYLIAEGKTLLFAGNVTTAHMLASTMALLCEHPADLERVRADSSLLKPMCEESLRIESPLQWHLRVCLEDTELGGVAIPQGALVAVLYGAGNRDGERFPEPDSFKIDRGGEIKHQLAFGYGPHLCLGAPLARLEGQIAFERLLARLDNIRIVPEKSDLRHIESTRFRAPRRIHIAFDRA